MRKSIIILIISFITLGTYREEPVKVMNGIMIDCARLLERKDYYFRLIDFMADWNMNTLVLHFSDDHGLSIKLPAFEKLARSNAFTEHEINNLINHGKKKGIEIIPELEVFGHTRYITDHPDYEHLYIGDRSTNISFNAINPLHQQTLDIMDSLITSVANIFPSKYIHIGCDEVNISDFCKKNGLDEATVWSDYVNKVIGIVHNIGRKPIIWNDHVRKNDRIADKLNKNTVLMEWNYDPEYNPQNINALLTKGYDNIIMAPSIACYRLRILPSMPGLQNTSAMAEAVRNKKASGLINTIWLPMRYIQNVMWYGIAYSGYLIDNEKKINVYAYHKEFSKKVFGIHLTYEMHEYLKNWTRLHLDHSIYKSIVKNDFSLSSAKIKSIKEVNKISEKLKNNQPAFHPVKNYDILKSIYLSTEVFYVISAGLLILNKKNSQEEQINFLVKEIDDTIIKLDAEWNKGRYPGDPNKYKAKFPNQEHSHLFIVLQKLKKAYQDRKNNIKL